MSVLFFRILAVTLLCAHCVVAQYGGELVFALRGEPKNLEPFAAMDEPSELVGYLTRAPLIRINRKTQVVEPALAESWKVSADGRRVDFTLRSNLRFSDGSQFTADDVAYTFERLLADETASPIADAFRSKTGDVAVRVADATHLALIFEEAVAGVERLIDPVHVLQRKGTATLGPFVLEKYEPGQSVLLKRNPHYWKSDAQGNQLPYLDTIKLQIQQNSQLELLRFRRGQYHLINGLDPTSFERLAASRPAEALDAGPSLDVEFLWFNQNPAAPIDSHRLSWFQSRAFRRAVDLAINRDDIVRVAYRGYATPAIGPISPANRVWFNRDLPKAKNGSAEAAKLLSDAGYQKRGAQLIDPTGRPVEFSLITNAGNETRKRMAAMIQQDLASLGITLNIVTLDFQSLIERITQSSDYESCLLGFVNVDLDPSAQQSVWESSGRSHAWNPGQESPATNWETRIDELMAAQSSTQNAKARKDAFFELQAIIHEQAPMIFLAHKNALSAVSTNLKNVNPGVLWPHVVWNVEELYLASPLSTNYR